MYTNGSIVIICISFFLFDRRNMFVFYVLTLFLFSPIKFVWSATPYKACKSDLGNIQGFDVTGCTTAPCIFTKGNTYAMNLTFQSTAPSDSVHVSIHGNRNFFLYAI